MKVYDDTNLIRYIIHNSMKSCISYYKSVSKYDYMMII